MPRPPGKRNLKMFEEQKDEVWLEHREPEEEWCGMKLGKLAKVRLCRTLQLGNHFGICSKTTVSY